MRSSLTCSCGGHFVTTSGLKLTNPAFFYAACERCGESARLYAGAGGTYHLTMEGALDSKRAALAAITNCTCCGAFLPDGKGVTSGNDIKVCRSCRDLCREARVSICDASRNPAMIGVKREDRSRVESAATTPRTTQERTAQ